MAKAALSFIVGGCWITFAIVIAEKLGNKVGGILLALPSTILVSMFFIGWTKSPEFAAEAASLAPFGMIATIIAIFTLVASLKKYRKAAFLIAFVIWLIAAIIIKIIGQTDMLAGILEYVIVTFLLFYVLERKMNISSVSGAKTSHTTEELIAKGIFAGGMVALTILVADISGPWWGGVLAAFPAATVASIYLLNKEHGPDFAMATGKAVLVASTNIIVYLIAVKITYPIYGLILGTIISYFSALFYVLLVYPLLKKIK